MDVITNRGTISVVNESTDLHLAAATRLSEDRQRHLWIRGGDDVRKVLARRPDLAPDLAASAVADTAFIGAWSSIPRTDSGLLEIAVRTASSETTLMGLTRQAFLTEASIELLAAKATPVVGWYLLQNHAVPTPLGWNLVFGYVSALKPMTDGPGRAFEEVLDRDPELWLAAVAASDITRFPIIRAAASRANTNVSLQEAIVDSLEQIERFNHTLDGRAERHFRSTVDELMRSPYLHTKEITRLLQLRNCTNRVEALQVRLDEDISSAISSLTCNANPDYMDVHCSEHGHQAPLYGANHVKGLETLARRLTDLRLPQELLASEALEHRAALSEDALNAILQSCRGVSSRNLAVTLHETGRFDDLLELTRRLGLLVLDEVSERKTILVQLAREGSSEINDRNIPSADALEIIRVFHPLRDVLHHPGLCAHVIEFIEQLPANQAETAFTLIGEWEGDLDSLLAATVALEL